MRLIKAAVANCSRSIKVRFNTTMVVDGASCLGHCCGKNYSLISILALVQVVVHAVSPIALHKD